MKKITIIIPCYNEHEVLPQLYKRLCAVLAGVDAYEFEILLINDGSRDNTLEVMKHLHEGDPRISYIDLSRNFGKELAMIAGLDHAEGDAVIIMDADLQHPPELIPEMLGFWQQGYDDVYTKRSSRADESFLKRWGANTFYKFLQRVTKITIHRDVGDFRLLDKRCVEALKLLRETQRYTKGMFSWIGYNKKEIIFDCQPRAAGATKWNYFGLLELAMEGITSFTTFPLKLATIFGFSISLVAFMYMAGVILKTMMFGDPVQGYPTLLSVILFLGGIQLIVLGIIGEYLGRVFNETKRRPLYLVNEYNGRKITYHKELINERRSNDDV
ncbi:MAG: glycosyltransferase family 2 protein [Pelosinus sp.]|nr:glycosyltransferase family 2 protein [Pelosinus sp.]